MSQEYESIRSIAQNKSGNRSIPADCSSMVWRVFIAFPLLGQLELIRYRCSGTFHRAQCAVSESAVAVPVALHPVKL